MAKVVIAELVFFSYLCKKKYEIYRLQNYQFNKQ
jgi:hypothetical protein